MKQYNTQEEAVRECGPNEITYKLTMFGRI